MLLVLYRADTGDILDIIPNGRVVDSCIVINGRPISDSLRCAWAYIPDQETAPFYRVLNDPPGVHVMNAKYPADVICFTSAEQAQLIDCDIAVAINKAIHPFAPQAEHFAVLHEQIAQILADFNQSPTERFRNLQAITEAEIAEGQKKKDALKK